VGSVFFFGRFGRGDFSAFSTGWAHSDVIAVFFPLMRPCCGFFHPFVPIVSALSVLGLSAFLRSRPASGLYKSTLPSDVLQHLLFKFPRVRMPRLGLGHPRLPLFRFPPFIIPSIRTLAWAVFSTSHVFALQVTCSRSIGFFHSKPAFPSFFFFSRPPSFFRRSGPCEGTHFYFRTPLPALTHPPSSPISTCWPFSQCVFETRVTSVHVFGLFAPPPNDN